MGLRSAFSHSAPNRLENTPTMHLAAWYSTEWRNAGTSFLLLCCRLCRLVEQHSAPCKSCRGLSCCMSKILHPQSVHRQVPEEFGNILFTGGETQTIHWMLRLHEIVSSLLRGTVVKGWLSAALSERPTRTLCSATAVFWALGGMPDLN